MLIFITLLILFISISLGGLYSYFVLYTTALSGQTVQKFKQKRNVFSEHFPLIALNLAILTFVTASALYFTEGAFSFSFPFIGTLILQIGIIMFMDDAFFYFFHRFMHKNNFLFTKIHKIHHKACPPFPLDFMYVHPLEWMLGSIGMVLGLLAVYGLYGEINVYAFWVCSAFRTLHEIEIHSGIKSIITQYIPLWGTTEHHDYHHSKLNGNYASTFTIWDKIFKTELTINKEKNK